MAVAVVAAAVLVLVVSLEPATVYCQERCLRLLSGLGVVDHEVAES